jgi:3-dehydroquinate synthetase
MRLDKKTSDGEIKFVLAEKIGQVVWGRTVPLALIEEVMAVV